MVKPAIRDATRLKRKQRVPRSDRTPDRTKAAEWIDEHVIPSERDWEEWTIKEIAEGSGWSREHISNTLDRYFEPAHSPAEDVLDTLTDGMVDAEHSGDGYREGLRDGFREGVKFALENPDLLGELARNDP